VKIEKVSIDCSGDDQRIVKYADMEVLKLSCGWWLWNKEVYVARHLPSGCQSRIGLFYTDSTVDFALTDCIYAVLVGRGVDTEPVPGLERLITRMGTTQE
jgi:hypothetical protein